MTLNERTQIGSHIAVAILCGVVAVCAIVLTTSLVHTDAGVDATLANINRKCQGQHGPDACGTLAQINKVAIAAGDVANETRIQVEQSGALIKATTKNLDIVGHSVTKTSQDIGELADALTETAHGATDTLATTKGAIAGLQPLELAATDSVRRAVLDFEQTNSDLDRIITSADIRSTLGDIRGMTEDGHKITTDAADEVHKLVHPPKVKLGFWGATMAAAKYVHQFSPPLF